MMEEKSSDTVYTLDDWFIELINSPTESYFFYP